ncbi:hypothetical protein ACXHXM_30090|uniref:hypothetical protein n=1 Tax=Rhizobium TaxID=379 RepID=UPI0003FE3F98|nr:MULTISPECIES: hypothetical protein [Rhizobium]
MLMGRQPRTIRLADVRGFAQHLAHFGALTEVPPSEAVPPARRTRPYIYSQIEIRRFWRRPYRYAGQRPSALDISLLFGLIAAAGLHHSEALSLLRANVGLGQSVLTIRKTKLCKSRLVPLHATPIAVLSDYAA